MSNSVKSNAIVTTNSIGWALLGITRAHGNISASLNHPVLMQTEALSDFLNLSWHELGLKNDDATAVCTLLSTMFPGNQNLVFDGMSSPSPNDAVDLVYKNWLSGKKEVIFHTSGSTGKASHALQTIDMLEQEATFAATLFPRTKTIIAFTPLHHCYAFMFGALLHSKLQIPIKTLPAFPTTIKNSLKAGCLLIGFPDFWRGLAKLNPIPVPNDVYCLSAGAIWEERDQIALREAGYTNTVEIFGSSENGLIGWRDHYSKPFKLAPYFERSSEHDPNSLVRIIKEKKSVIPLQDELQWLTGNTFLPLKRLDKAVQVSGMNVYPKKIELCLLEMPEVKECKVRLMRQEEGRRLKAFIVLNSGVSQADALSKLKKFCLKSLSAPERPGKYSFGRHLPKKYGKDTDW